MNKLNGICTKHLTVGNVRGIGMMLAIEMVTDKESRIPASELTKKVRKYAHQRGVLVEVGGHYSNVIRLLPSLVIPEKLLMNGIDIIDGGITELENGKLK